MFNIIKVLLITLFVTFFAAKSFAISPGAGQAQIRNNTQEMLQNQKRMEQMRKDQYIQQQQQKAPTTKKIQKRAYY